MSTEEQIVSLLLERKLTVTTAESCTGGMVASRLVNVAGVSECFSEGYVTYSEQAKQRLLHVKKETLEQFTVYSEETAAEMALGAAELSGAELAVATTGIAGPDGGTENFPVGLVCIGVAFQGRVRTKRCYFKGDRAKIRSLATEESLHLLLEVLSL